MKLLGIDVGSSSIKLTVLDSQTGEALAKAQYPEKEMAISSPKAGWAEQSPEDWWANIKAGMQIISKQIDPKTIGAIGISYQMHGLVCVDKEKNVIRPSIIWCDSRAVEVGNKAFHSIGEEKCLKDLLNSPGNFTASKLAWVKENEPELFAKIDKIMLPGDYVAMKLTGTINTTISGLSEGIMWNYTENNPAKFLLDYYGIPEELIADITPSFGNQGEVSSSAALELGLKEGVPVTYRAGDQPNNAFSLNVLNPGEIAATAGTSGVVYAISDEQKFDPKSRVNAFAHVNYEVDSPRYGILLCINGTGILNSWMNKNVGTKEYSYEEMNNVASKIAIGSDGLVILPFGNGAERVLENKNPGSQISNLTFTKHTAAHMFRATQEGIAFSFMFGIELMEKYNGVDLKTIRAGHANMFLSPVFRNTLASVTNQPIEIYDTDGAAGAARGAGLGAGIYKDAKETFSTLKVIKTITPDAGNADAYNEAYANWKNTLQKII
ncbi:MAG: carbohydrate kinase [Bacteroidales bacterium]|nr:carbohydrate kinase [Bacteroidales bacterium]MBN2819641.1 carbohydrate kinase [Bacteroidales bacterium]